MTKHSDSSSNNGDMPSSDESSVLNDDDMNKGSASDYSDGSDQEVDYNKFDVTGRIVPALRPSNVKEEIILEKLGPFDILRSMVEMAQSCHFLRVFGPILKLPSISRQV
jgi:hypothetical protein